MSSSVLLADIGGTNIRLAISTGSGAPLECIRSMRCADFDRPLDAVRQYLDVVTNSGAPVPGQFCVAVAAAVRGDFIRLTNNHWHFSQTEMAQSLDMPVTVLNDFEAQAWCLLHPGRLSLRWLQKPANLVAADSASWPPALRTIAGPGTGFGAASLTPGGEVISAEPGHIAFAPQNETDMSLLQQLWRWYPRVTIEHLISGPGIANIFCAVNAVSGDILAPANAPGAADIVAMADSDLCAQQSLQIFSRWMGAVCGDLALAKGSRGGFLLSGELLGKLGKHFDEIAFMNAFTDKLLFRQWCEAIPVAYVKDEVPGLSGCAAFVYHMKSSRREL